MKVENTEIPPKFNLLKPDGVRAQGHAEDVTHVLLNDGHWYKIKSGSFKFYKVSSEKGVPYVTFITTLFPDDDDEMVMEVFPATVCGLAYPSTPAQVTSDLAPVKFK